MRYFKAAIFFALAIAGILFGISNQDYATVHIFWYFSKSYPLYLVLFACFLVGTVAAIIYSFFSGGTMKDEERRLSKHVENLKGRINHAHASTSSRPSSGSTDGPAGSTS